MTSVARISAVVAAAAALMVTAGWTAPGGPWERRVEEIPRTLDSLAALSVGPYVHFEVYGCPGGRCETRVSIWRGDGGRYTYRGYAWMGLPGKPQWRGFTAELPMEEAGTLLAAARVAGVLSLIADSSGVDRWTPRFWLRARFGETTLSIDGATLASAVYRDSTSAGRAREYTSVYDALVAPIRARHKR